MHLHGYIWHCTCTCFIPRFFIFIHSLSIPEITAPSMGEWACTWVPSVSQHVYVKVCLSSFLKNTFTIYFFFTLFRFCVGAGGFTCIQQGRRNWGWPVSQNSIKLFEELAWLSSPSCFPIVILDFSIFCLQIFDFSTALCPTTFITLFM